MKIEVQDYQLYLFDMDGLLVDTEALHFQAYQRFLTERGYDLPWSLQQYQQIAHSGSDALKEAIYSLFPDLLEKEPNWQRLYEEKRACYMEILRAARVRLMPGVEPFLSHLLSTDRKLCVVTNSTRAQVELIQQQQPFLGQIEHWLVREEYERSKPDPQCYKLAISRWAYPGDQIIGFEDSARGLIALINTAAHSVLVSRFRHPALEAYQGHYQQVDSFEQIELVSRS